ADWGVDAAVWSVTSWAELRRDALDCGAAGLTDVGAEPRTPYVRQRLDGQAGPVVATSDFDPAQPDLIRPFLKQEFATLGADGFGFSDTRAAEIGRASCRDRVKDGGGPGVLIEKR